MTAASPAVRRFQARLIFIARLRRLLRDPSDVLTLIVIACIGVGVAGLTQSLFWSLIAIGTLIAPLTPIATSVRLFIRGK